ncbi:MAG: transposase (08) [Candidatus Carbobacillus altaicus]|uniref:Transposase (08) n=1 Tax=Candidatus Carbonibacillus altaicus TaxID=2163959 RepID=A0A2R6Y2J3_9BACL|nr:MAG: transposase (08) [Candidatus Carbobacillus altaicus]
MTYDEELNEWICANNNRLTFRYEKKQKSDNGYESIKRVYLCADCHGCSFQASCAKGKESKRITVSMENQKQRKDVQERLATEGGSLPASRGDRLKQQGRP